MTSSPPSVIFILASIHHVLRAEKALLKAGLAFELIPVPKEVNPDCGLALEVKSEGAEIVRKALRKAGLKIRAEYRRQGREFKALITD
ncbi:MAG: DUF3343 domain-containing protein [Thermodesulfobacteriota bacterium]